ncbi:Hsp20/alpha crystallin family protein [Dehalogenimonas sp. THU2]|uniref:Hsp20/alpha crystallin family protein n=1 Tax=Dehalogenimonas sp. THU2 TaxID=3151121 RepID=UPI0032183199
MMLQKWDPFREMRAFERALNRPWRGTAWPEETEQWNIPIDVVRKGEEIIVKASMPGVKPEDIEVSVENNVLTLKAESATDNEMEEGGYMVRERAWGSFYRALSLPDTVDTARIEPVYANGVLTITLPTAEDKKRKQIKVAVKKEEPKAIESK